MFADSLPTAGQRHHRSNGAAHCHLASVNLRPASVGTMSAAVGLAVLLSLLAAASSADSPDICSPNPCRNQGPHACMFARSLRKRARHTPVHLPAACGKRPRRACWLGRGSARARSARVPAKPVVYSAVLRCCPRAVPAAMAPGPQRRLLVRTAGLWRRPGPPGRRV